MLKPKPKKTDWYCANLQEEIGREKRLEQDTELGDDGEEIRNYPEDDWRENR